MIRTRTCLVVGAGASSELQIPGNEELMAKFAQGLDFSRLGSPVQSRDMTMLSQYFAKLAAMESKSKEDVINAANRLFSTTKMARSVDGVLSQNDDDPLILACGKLAIVYLICQAEAKSILRLTPRVAGDLPMQGTDTWLYQLGQIVTSGVSRAQVENCLDNLTITCFNYDRSIEHFLPHAFVMAFGMSLDEAQTLVGEKLRIFHPYGTVGRLPWQQGEGAEVEWATEAPSNIFDVMTQIRTADEAMQDKNLLLNIRSALFDAKRVAFLGFGFQSLNVKMLVDHGIPHDPEVVMTTWEMSDPERDSALRILKRKFGSMDNETLLVTRLRAFEVLRDYSLLFES